jgi:hypothetical protein
MKIDAVLKGLPREYQLDWRAWLGIFATGLTLFGRLEGIIIVAGWIRYLVSHWRLWTYWFWDTIFFWLKIKLSPISKDMLTYFCIIMILRVRAGVQLERELKSLADKRTPEQLMTEIRELYTVGTARSMFFFIAILLFLIFMLSSRQGEANFSALDFVVFACLFFSLFFSFVFFAGGARSEYMARLMIFIIIKSFQVCVLLVLLNFLSLLGPTILELVKPPR